VHGDLCGPVTLATPGGWRYFLLLVDDLSRYMWVVVLGSKGEAANAITRAQAAAEVECGHKLRVQPAAEWRRRAAQPDGCGDGSGPPQAGGMPAVFWGEAVVTAVYILNRSPIKALNGRTLYEACMGTSRRSHLWVFGCLAFGNELGHIGKLDDRSTPARMPTAFLTQRHSVCARRVM
jgi:hypothetical protein